ncbi:MAG: Gfo/Idh/MocA family oxidoreductase [Planctomycetaceae bacterium]|nr:Gfo/Idh/MocA family oxidoreductase [Planctomycetaceae bacterium]
MKRNKIVTVGMGDVLKKVRPALTQLHQEGLLDAVTYVDTKSLATIQEEQGHISLEAHERFVQSKDGNLPIAELRRMGMCGDSTVVLICSPSRFHVHQTLQAAEISPRIGTEKPLSLSVSEARLLEPIRHQVFPIGHQMFKAGPLDLADQMRRGLIPVERIERIEFALLEEIGLADRAVDDVVSDLAWHGKEIIVQPFAAAGLHAEVELEQVQVGRYHESGRRAKTTTVAQISGGLSVCGRWIPFSIHVGKRMPMSCKGLVIYGENDEILVEANLNEGGFLAHYRLIRELLTAPAPNMQLSFDQVLQIVGLCEQAQHMTFEEQGHYVAGTFPEWFDLPKLVLDSLQGMTVGTPAASASGGK